MKSLFLLSVHLEGSEFGDSYALGRIIVNIIFFVPIIYVCFLNRSRRRQGDSIFGMLEVAAVSLLV
jgi:amino acid permease